MKTTLGDLNEYLFEQLDRLTDDDLKGKKLETEKERSKAVVEVAKTIISNGNLVLQANKFMDGKLNKETVVPKMLGGQSGTELS